MASDFLLEELDRIAASGIVVDADAEAERPTEVATS
jgi:hypothetical protein